MNPIISMKKKGAKWVIMRNKKKDTDSGEGVAGIGDKETSFANSSISNGDALDEP